LDYVKSVPQDGRLFPELKPGPFNKLSASFGKWFARFVRERGVTDPRKAPLHSLRHLFKLRCREAGLTEEVHDALTGHASSGSVGRTYGGSMLIKVLGEAMARVQFPELETLG
jgi:integrase